MFNLAIKVHVTKVNVQSGHNHMFLLNYLYSAQTTCDVILVFRGDIPYNIHLCLLFWSNVMPSLWVSYFS